MAEHSKINTIGFIKRNLEVLSWTMSLSIAVVFLLVTRFVFGFLNYIPMNSVIVFLAVLAVLSAAVYGLSRRTTQRAIAAIESYGSKIDALLVTSRDVHGIDYSDVLIEKIMDTAIALTNADGGSLLTADDDSIEFKLVRGANAETLLGTRIPRGKGVVGAVIAEGASMRVSDAKTDERHFGGVDDRTGYRTRSILCVPLIMDGKSVGALEMVKSVPDHFTKDDEEVLQYFAAQAALSMKNSQYHEDMRNFETHLTNILVNAIEHISEKRGHSRMVARYAVLVGRASGLTEEEMEVLYKAAILHDIGFLKMDLQNIKTVKDYHAHATLGYELLRQISFYHDIASIVLHHHERFDGNGYPNGLKGEMVPLMSRIIGIAEAFDVMTNRFSFKNAGKEAGNGREKTAAFQRALGEVKANAGTQFDPQLAELFIKTLNEDDIEPSEHIPYSNTYEKIMTV